MQIFNIVSVRGNQDWTIQRHWQHWTFNTQNEDKQTNKIQKTKMMSNMDLPQKKKKRVWTQLPSTG